MAANPKRLRVVAARALGSATRELEIECVEGGAFEAVGGKYIIVHSGVMLGEKAVKRAYSLMPVPARPGRATLAVKLLAGPGSRVMHDLPLGATLSFSGPWGKLVPESGLGERTLLVATDTGITAALGIVEQHALSREHRALCVVWLREPSETFLDVDSVRRRVEQTGARFCDHDIASIDAPTRFPTAQALVEDQVKAFEASHVVVSGDGAIAYPLRESLPARLALVRDVRIECFFNNPDKKSA